MTATLRKGWCPGALRPMAAKDGLLVRLRLPGGILPAGTAHAIADLATRHGNGLFDLSARANLQIRGVNERALPALHDGLHALGLLDTSAAAESVRNIMASPLAGLHDGIDIRPLIEALGQRLASDPSLHALPGKFGFLVDDGTRPTLAGIDADVRFEWTCKTFAIGLGGTRADAVLIGSCDRGDVIAHAVGIAHGFLSMAARNPDARRIRDFVGTFGAEAVAEACGGRRRDALTPIAPTDAREIVGRHEHLSWLGLAVPFGRLDAAMLRSVADVAAATQQRELRLTPWRVILVPGAERSANIPGFITDRDDPRLAVVACVGAAGCARGTTDTHADASILAATLARAAGIHLHVSGCEKGCAKSSPTPVALVARNGRYDLVRNGRANETPMRRGLDLAAARVALETAPEPA